jgi:hypothetical protein
LFGEAPSRIVISAPAKKVNEIMEIARRKKAPCQKIGVTAKADLKLQLGEKSIMLPMCQITETYYGALQKALEQTC